MLDKTMDNVDIRRYSQIDNDDDHKDVDSILYYYLKVCYS